MAVSFAVGSSCFLIGPFPGYAELVGEGADAITFFVGSIFFTLGGALQSSIAWPGRRRRRCGDRGVARRDRAVGGHAVLQRHHLPGP